MQLLRNRLFPMGLLPVLLDRRHCHCCDNMLPDPHPSCENTMIFRPSSHMSGLAFCCSISTRTQSLSIAALGVDRWRLLSRKPYNLDLHSVLVPLLLSGMEILHRPTPTLLPRLPITAPVGGHNKEDTSRPLQLRRSSSCKLRWLIDLFARDDAYSLYKALRGSAFENGAAKSLPGPKFFTGELTKFTVCHI